MEKKITVVVPVYNSEHTIRECLDSLFNVNYSNFEVILVNDFSTDSSLEIARMFPVKIINLIKRKGPGFARDRGTALASGEIVAFLDSDCIVPKDWLHKINKKLTLEIVGLGGKYDLPKNSNMLSQLFITYCDIKSIFYKKSRETQSFSGGNCAFWRHSLMRSREKKELVYCDKIAGGEDTMMCYELSRFGKLIYDPELSVIHNKRYSIFKISEKSIRSAHTGIMVLCIVGRALIKEPDRIYKFIIYVFSVIIFLLLLLSPSIFAQSLYGWLLVIYFLIQLPIMILASKNSTIRFSVVFFPLIIFLVNILYFVGHIKRFQIKFKSLLFHCNFSFITLRRYI